MTRCEYPGCTSGATTSYRDKARKLWRLCEGCRALVRKRRT